MVKNNITAQAKNKRLYPDIKEHVSVWSKDSYEVERIDVSHGQHFYKLKR